MKKSVFSVLLLTFFLGCTKDPHIPIAQLEGLGIYWHHSPFAEGRKLLIQLAATNPMEEKYDLVFDYTIESNTITIKLLDAVNKGDCPRFPMPRLSTGGKYTCTSLGKVIIPEDELEKGTYAIRVVTPYFSETGELIVGDEKWSLNFPAAEKVSGGGDIYPIPKNLLWASFSYKGDSNSVYAGAFFDDLKALGLTETTVPNYPYLNLSVNDDGFIPDSDVNDNYVKNGLYNKTVPFKDAVDIAKKHFGKQDIYIKLWSSNGDQAHFSPYGGITIVYVE